MLTALLLWIGYVALAVLVIAAVYIPIREAVRVGGETKTEYCFLANTTRGEINKWINWSHDEGLVNSEQAMRDLLSVYNEYYPPMRRTRVKVPVPLSANELAVRCVTEDIKREQSIPHASIASRGVYFTQKGEMYLRQTGRDLEWNRDA